MVEFREDFLADNKKLKWERLDNGTYRVHMTLGTANQELEYLNEDGTIRKELITEEELFSVDSLKTAYGAPILLGHPKNKTFNQNAEGLLVGATMETFLNQDGKLLMTATILDSRAVKLIDDVLASDSGLMPEISPGYFLTDKKEIELDKFEQIGRRYDHFALLNVDEGRAGQESVLRLDSKAYNLDENYIHVVEEDRTNIYRDIETDEDGNILSEYQYIVNTKSVTTSMAKFQLFDEVIEVEETEIDGKKYYNDTAIKTVLDSAKKCISTEKGKTATLDGKVTTLQAQLDSKEDLITLDAAGQMIAESVELWNKVLPRFQADSADFQPDYTLQPVEVKELYIRKFMPNVNLDAAKEKYSGDQFGLYLNGLWEGVSLDTAATKKAAISKVQAQLDRLNVKTAQETLTEDSNDDPVTAAWAEEMARIQGKK